MSHPPIGMQVNVFSGKYPVAAEHTNAILDGVVSAGFSAVEGGPPSDPLLRKKMLKERGLRYAGGHTVCAGLDDDAKVDDLIRDLHTCEATDLCNSGLWNWFPQDLENFKYSIDLLNRVGRRFRKEGIHLHYHNHDFEFKAVKGTEADPRIGMQILLDRLDPTACDLCVYEQDTTEIDPVESARISRAFLRAKLGY